MFSHFSGLQVFLQENEGILSKLHDRVKQEGGDVSCLFPAGKYLLKVMNRTSR